MTYELSSYLSSEFRGTGPLRRVSRGSAGGVPPPAFDEASVSPGVRMLAAMLSRMYDLSDNPSHVMRLRGTTMEAPLRPS